MEPIQDTEEIEEIELIDVNLDADDVENFDDLDIDDELGDKEPKPRKSGRGFF